VVIGASLQDPGAVNSFFRSYDVDAGAADPVAQIRAVGAWINANGGIAGHPLELRIREYSEYGRPTSQDDYATCAEWQNGPRPLAAVDTHSSTDILLPCLAKAGIASVQSGSATPATPSFNSYPSDLYTPGGAALDRVQSAYVQGLAAGGFFKGERVGLLTAIGLPQLRTAKNALGAALRNAGIDPVAESDISLEDPVSFFASEASAVLRFHIRKVTRVVALDQNGLAVGQFMRGAQAQGFHPLYGISSVSAPAFLAAQAPSAQLRGAVGVGWSPLLDVGASDDPGSGEVRALCAQIFAAAGVSLGSRTPFGRFAAFAACDSLLAVRDALQASQRFSLDGLRAGMEQLGSRRSAVTLTAHMDASRHDGASGWRALRYEGSCGCFRYDGPVRDI
jgi:hypothetical protein